MATLLPPPEIAPRRRRGRLAAGGVVLALLLAGFAPRNQRALFVTEGDESPSAFLALPESHVIRFGGGFPPGFFAPVRPGGRVPGFRRPGTQVALAPPAPIRPPVGIGPVPPADVGFVPPSGTLPDFPAGAFPIVPASYSPVPNDLPIVSTFAPPAPDGGTPGNPGTPVTPTPAPTDTPTPVGTPTPEPSATPTPAPTPGVPLPPVSPVPEPATWFSLIAGMFVSGIALRRRGRAKREAGRQPLADQLR